MIRRQGNNNTDQNKRNTAIDNTGLSFFGLHTEHKLFVVYPVNTWFATGPFFFCLSRRTTE